MSDPTPPAGPADALAPLARSLRAAVRPLGQAGLRLTGLAQRVQRTLAASASWRAERETHGPDQISRFTGEIEARLDEPAGRFEPEAGGGEFPDLPLHPPLSSTAAPLPPASPARPAARPPVPAPPVQRTEAAPPTPPSVVALPVPEAAPVRRRVVSQVEELPSAPRPPAQSSPAQRRPETSAPPATVEPEVVPASPPAESSAAPDFAPAEPTRFGEAPAAPGDVPVLAPSSSASAGDQAPMVSRALEPAQPSAPMPQPRDVVPAPPEAAPAVQRVPELDQPSEAPATALSESTSLRLAEPTETPKFGPPQTAPSAAPQSRDVVPPAASVQRAPEPDQPAEAPPRSVPAVAPGAVSVQRAPQSDQPAEAPPRSVPAVSPPSQTVEITPPAVAPGAVSVQRAPQSDQPAEVPPLLASEPRPTHDSSSSSPQPPSAEIDEQPRLSEGQAYGPAAEDSAAVQPAEVHLGPPSSPSTEAAALPPGEASSPAEVNAPSKLSVAEPATASPAVAVPVESESPPSALEAALPGPAADAGAASPAPAGPLELSTADPLAGLASSVLQRAARPDLANADTWTESVSADSDWPSPPGPRRAPAPEPAKPSAAPQTAAAFGPSQSSPAPTVQRQAAPALPLTPAAISPAARTLPPHADETGPADDQAPSAALPDEGFSSTASLLPAAAPEPQRLPLTQPVPDTAASPEASGQPWSRAATLAQLPLVARQWTAAQRRAGAGAREASPSVAAMSAPLASPFARHWGGESPAAFPADALPASADADWLTPGRESSADLTLWRPPATVVLRRAADEPGPEPEPARPSSPAGDSVDFILPGSQAAPPLAAQRAQAEAEPTGPERAAAEAPEASSQPAAAPDLDELARQVFPLVKRLLAVERERRGGRI